MSKQENLNFLYCIDENYNFQCYISICSLLKYSNNEITVHIIHQNPDSFNKYFEKLNIRNVEINLYHFEEKETNFVSLRDHISEATYYRLYIQKYLNNSIKNIIYIDADIFANNPFTDILQSTLTQLNRSGNIIGAFDIVNYNKFTYKKPYFNAGLLIIDYQRWISEDLTEKLHTKLKNETELKYWDQDLLNNHFGENFLNINEFLNFHISLEDKVIKLSKNHIKNNALFVHYVGKTKPWDLNGMFLRNSFIYHQLIKEFNNGNLMLVVDSKNDILNFYLKNLSKIFRNSNFLYYVKNLFYSFRKD